MTKKSNPTITDIAEAIGFQLTALTIYFLESNIVGIPQRYDNAKNLPLNKYGSSKFCKFKVSGVDLNHGGIYVFVVNGKVKYVGKTNQTFEKRFSANGYGSISPRNCFEGGQSTNCKLNAQMNNWYNNKDKIEIYITTDKLSETQINNLEDSLLATFNFALNTQNN